MKSIKSMERRLDKAEEQLNDDADFVSLRIPLKPDKDWQPPKWSKKSVILIFPNREMADNFKPKGGWPYCRDLKHIIVPEKRKQLTTN